MIETLGFCVNPQRYVSEYNAKAEQFSDYKLGKEIANRQHLLREATIRSGVGVGLAFAAKAAVETVVPEASRIVFYATLPTFIATLIVGPGRGNMRTAELGVLENKLDNRYPKELTQEAVLPNQKVK